ncbi:MAG: hypothetical protein EZS28_052528, partial [Streblomastix strix]
RLDEYWILEPAFHLAPDRAGVAVAAEMRARANSRQALLQAKTKSKVEGKKSNWQKLKGLDFKSISSLLNPQSSSNLQANKTELSFPSFGTLLKAFGEVSGLLHWEDSFLIRHYASGLYLTVASNDGMENLMSFKRIRLRSLPDVKLQDYVKTQKKNAEKQTDTIKSVSPQNIATTNIKQGNFLAQKQPQGPLVNPTNIQEKDIPKPKSKTQSSLSFINLLQNTFSKEFTRRRYQELDSKSSKPNISFQELNENYRISLEKSRIVHVEFESYLWKLTPLSKTIPLSRF